MNFLFYIMMFVAVKEVECKVKEIYFCPEESATIFCNITSDFTKMYWKDSTDYVVASQTFENGKNTKDSPRETYSSSDRFDAQGLSLKIASPKDGEQLYCDVVSRQKEKKQHFTLVEYSEPYPDGVLCNSPKHQIEDTNRTLEGRQPRSRETQKIIRKINETTFVCINGTATLKCDDGQNGRPVAEYWYDTDKKMILSNVAGRLGNTSDARYIYNRMNSTLLVKNVSKYDNFFLCDIYYQNEEHLKGFKLKDGTPKKSGFQGFENKQCEVDANENGEVNIIFEVVSFSPNDGVNVHCELNSNPIGTNPQYNITDDGNFNLQIFINTKIELSQNLKCTVSGPAMCDHIQEYVCHFKQNSENNNANLGTAVVASVVVVGVILVCIYYFYKKYYLKK